MSPNLVMWETVKSAFLHLSMLSHLSSPPPLLPVAAHPRLISLPPFISCWVDEWVTNMDQTQTRQTAAPPSHPSLLPLPHLSILIFLSISLPHPLITYSQFVFFSVHSHSFYPLSSEWMKHMWKWQWNKREVLDNIKRRNGLNNRAKKTEWKYKYILFTEVIIFLYLYPYKTKNLPILLFAVTLLCPFLLFMQFPPAYLLHPPHSFSNLPSSTLIYPAPPES